MGKPTMNEPMDLLLKTWWFSSQSCWFFRGIKHWIQWIFWKWQEVADLHSIIFIRFYNPWLEWGLYLTKHAPFARIRKSQVILWSTSRKLSQQLISRIYTTTKAKLLMPNSYPFDKASVSVAQMVLFSTRKNRLLREPNSSPWMIIATGFRTPYVRHHALHGRCVRSMTRMPAGWTSRWRSGCERPALTGGNSPRLEE